MDIIEEIKDFEHDITGKKKLNLKKNPKALLFIGGAVLVVILVLLKGGNQGVEYYVPAGYDGYPKEGEGLGEGGGGASGDLSSLLSEFKAEQNGMLNDMISEIANQNNTAYQNMSDNNDVKFDEFVISQEEKKVSLYESLSGMTDPRLSELSNVYMTSREKGDAIGMASANREANAIRDSIGQSRQDANGDIRSIGYKKIAQLGVDYNLAKSKGDVEGMRKANEQANLIRQNTGQQVYDASGDIKNTASKSTSKSNGSSSGRTLTATADGKAPKGAKVGDTIKTAGGNYKITGGSNGNYTSVKV